MFVFQADRLQAYPEGVLSDKFKFNKKRVRTLSGNDGFLAREAKGVVYYMHRDQRVQDNWALIYAQRLAYQVWPLSQLYSVDFSQSKIGVKKCISNKWILKVCVSCS